MTFISAFFSSDNYLILTLFFLPGLINFGIFLYSLTNFPNTKINYSFSVFILLLAFWQIVEGLLHLSDTIGDVNTWFKISNIFTVMVVPFGIIFAFNLFSWKSDRFKIWVFASQFVPAIALSIANIKSDILINAIHVPGWHWISNPIPNWINGLSYAWILVNGIIFMVILLLKYKNSKTNQLVARQALTLAIGFGVPFLSGLTFEMALPFLFKVDVVPITVSLMTVFSLSSFIVIKKYRLLDFSPVNQWELIINSLEESVFITDKTDTIMYANATFCKMSGYHIDELIGNKAGNFFPEATTYKIDHTTLGKSFNSQLLTKSGKTIWVQISSSDYKLDDEVVGHIALLTNISAIKETKQDLADERNKVKMAIESGQMVSYNVNLSTHEIELSENAAQILGLTETKGKIEDLIFPHIDHSFKYVFDKIVEGQISGPIQGELIEFMRPDNFKTVWLQLKANFTKNELNGDTIMQGLLLDITEDKQKTHELLQLKIGLEINKNRLLQAQEIAHLGSWEVNLQTQRSVWSDEAYRIYGIEPGDHNISFEKWISFIHPEDRDTIIPVLKKARETNSGYTITHRIVRPDGSIRHVRHVTLFDKMVGMEPTTIFGVVQDITDSKTYENKLKKLLEITERQNKSLQNFAYIVSHNIRSHSANISGLSDIVYQENNSPAHEMLLQSAHKLSETINNLNSIITMQNSADKTFHAINLHEQINKTIDAVNHLIALQDAKIDNQVDKAIVIDGIPSYIESILLNLITNAIKYKKDKQDVTVTIAAKDEGDYIVLSIKDNGKGIDLNKYKNSVFGLYKTFHGNKDAKGMGLFIVKNQIESMHGKIEVESTVDVGTEFKIFFNKNPFEFDELINS